MTAIKCSNVSKSKPFLGKAKWCFIMTNPPDGVKYRNAVVKRIQKTRQKVLDVSLFQKFLLENT
jgi:hypothetical protein